MFKKFFIAFLLSAALCSQCFAITPPKPITGRPGLMAGKNTNIHAGEYTFTFALPSGWGMGSFKTNPEGSGSFQLFPQEGGVGCTITIEKSEDAVKSLEKIRKKFSSFKEIKNGFEVEMSKAFFCCQTTSDLVIQIWYSLPKKSKEHAKIWKSLRKCLTISRDVSPDSHEAPAALNDASSDLNDSPENDHPAFAEISDTEWAFYHPTEDKHLTLTTTRPVQCVPYSQEYNSYLLLEDGKCLGYFTVKWDQLSARLFKPAIENPGLYDQFLDEMLQDLLTFEPTQQINDAPKYHQEFGLTELKGEPFNLTAFSGFDCLVGMAINNDAPEDFTMKFNINKK